MFKNEETIKDMIVGGHKRGICDSDGRSVKSEDGRFIAKPRARSSVSQVFVCRNGVVVPKD